MKQTAVVEHVDDVDHAVSVDLYEHSGLENCEHSAEDIVVVVAAEPRLAAVMRNAARTADEIAEGKTAV